MPHSLISRVLLIGAVALHSALALAQTSAPTTDKRLPINVSQAEKNQMLYEMREFLHGFHAINIALARGDMQSLAITAKPMGALLERLPSSLKEHLPEEFLQLAIAMNEALQVLARDAVEKGDTRLTHENLAEVITYCSGCHDTYRFNVVASRARK
jgi:cytochrome c553